MMKKVLKLSTSLSLLDSDALRLQVRTFGSKSSIRGPGQPHGDEVAVRPEDLTPHDLKILKDNGIALVDDDKENYESETGTTTGSEGGTLPERSKEDGGHSDSLDIDKESQKTIDPNSERTKADKSQERTIVEDENTAKVEKREDRLDHVSVLSGTTSTGTPGSDTIVASGSNDNGQRKQEDESIEIDLTQVVNPEKKSAQVSAAEVETQEATVKEKGKEIDSIKRFHLVVNPAQPGARDAARSLEDVGYSENRHHIHLQCPKCKKGFYTMDEMRKEDFVSDVPCFFDCACGHKSCGSTADWAKVLYNEALKQEKEIKEALEEVEKQESTALRTFGISFLNKSEREELSRQLKETSETIEDFEDIIERLKKVEVNEDFYHRDYMIMLKQLPSYLNGWLKKYPNLDRNMVMKHMERIKNFDTKLEKRDSEDKVLLLLSKALRQFGVIKADEPDLYQLVQNLINIVDPIAAEMRADSRKYLQFANKIQFDGRVVKYKTNEQMLEMTEDALCELEVGEEKIRGSLTSHAVDRYSAQRKFELQNKKWLENLRNDILMKHLKNEINLEDKDYTFQNELRNLLVDCLPYIDGEIKENETAIHKFQKLIEHLKKIDVKKYENKQKDQTSPETAVV